MAIMQALHRTKSGMEIPMHMKTDDWPEGQRVQSKSTS
jgi:hypothetical protein